LLFARNALLVVPTRGQSNRGRRGEVKALDPADYFPVTINKSITITGVQGAGIDSSGGTAISNPIGSGATVNLTNLIIRNVSGSGDTGISAPEHGLMTVTHCTVQGYGTGIGSFESTLLIVDSIVTNNKIGIEAVTSVADLNHVIVSFNTNVGVISTRGSAVRAVDTIADNNGDGFDVGSGGLFLAHSTASGNAVGINILGGGSATSFGDNHIKGNGTDVKGGTLTNVGTQ
jgi:hypothetical protein